MKETEDHKIEVESLQREVSELQNKCKIEMKKAKEGDSGVCNWSDSNFSWRNLIYTLATAFTVWNLIFDPCPTCHSAMVTAVNNDGHLHLNYVELVLWMGGVLYFDIRFNTFYKFNCIAYLLCLHESCDALSVGCDVSVVVNALWKNSYWGL